MPKAPPNTVVISDLHGGCKLALCPPEPVKLIDGGTYTLSAFQAKLWAYWREFWDEWVPMVTKGESWDLVINGDALDGVHHRATTQISHDLGDQGEIAYSVIRPILDLPGFNRLYMIAGTEAHVGPSAVEEERLAKRLEAIPDETGRHARFDLWKQIGTETKKHRAGLAHIMHHIGTTGRAAYESSGPQAELIAEFAEAGRWNEQPPDFVVRSHRHRYICVENPAEQGTAYTMVTPGWQGKTPFAYRIAGGRVAPPQFGGILLRQGDEDIYKRHRVFSMKRARVEV